MTTNLPLEITAGDAASWTETLDDYLSPTYSAKYRFVGPMTFELTEDSADGADHDFVVSGATSAGWAPGVYKWALFAVAAADSARKTLETGTIEILANPETEGLAGAVDSRSHVKRVLDALEAVLEGKASRDVSQYALGGKQITKLGIEELLAWRDKYLALYRAELRRAKQLRGETTSSTIRAQNLGRRF